MPGDYYGKDGTFYKTWEERKRADAKWEQQEKQNKLLQEQNNLIRQQQEEERRQRMEEREQEIVQQYEEQKQALREKGQRDFERIFMEEIEPLMLKSGIKDPVTYYKKLRELYEEKPSKEYLKLLTEDMDPKNEMTNYPLELSEKIEKLPPPLKKVTMKFKILFALFEGAFMGIIGFLAGEPLLGAILGIIGFVSGFIVMLFINSNSKTNLERKAKRKEKIDLINTEIEEHNKNIRKEVEEWENKIKKFEQRRMENFDYSLEIALDRLTIIQSLLVADKFDLEYYNKLDYTLKFNKYPKDWEERKNEYYNNMNKEKAINDGTEMFLNL